MMTVSRGRSNGGAGASASLRRRAMARPGWTKLFLLFLMVAFSLGAFIPDLSPLPTTLSNSHPLRQRSSENVWGFKIADDLFWKDGEPFLIIGGDLHYFRVLPEHWEDRLLRAKALGLNTIQTYVPWNLHEPLPQKWVFEGIANIESFLKLTHKLGFLVLLRAGPYICAEWDLGGFPAWILAIEPAVKLRSSDPAYLSLVERWWGILLPKLVPFLYENGGPIVMVQVENEFGSFGDDKTYLHHLVTLARGHLGNDIILYTTDGGTAETLEKGTIPDDGVYAAVDFSLGEDPWPIFGLQKKFNTPGKSPPLSAEFYTGWLTHWGEQNAHTDAKQIAVYLEKILSRNGSVVLYMAHGGTNFGFFSGANTGQNDSDYKADLTSYDYDAPIKESGDVDNFKFQAIRRVIAKYTKVSLPPVPSINERAKLGLVKVNKVAFFFNVLHYLCRSREIVETDQPIPMELVGQAFGFLLYVSEFSGKQDRQTLSIPKVHDRAQVFVSCSLDDDGGRPRFVGIIERWSNRELEIPNMKCSSNTSVFILVENMGHINYGPYIFDRKGILSSVILGGYTLRRWKLCPLSLGDFSFLEDNLVLHRAHSQTINNKMIAELKYSLQSISQVPGFYEAHFFIDPHDQIKDTFISFRGWNKGVAFVNNFNIGRFWPFVGPQCTLYVPAPLLQHGNNILVIFELHASNPDLTIAFVEQPDFTCGKMQQ
ncbi:Beta-galactosidase 8 [Apostasia shenzhenica]|uniref:Beta-galactosidase n=1 Tax=Apostasia shenzhenica TaxID=1088818 RepID=A0A2I0AP01_9ASPA|nr:Beta-galactosidase 8 [Apostasia shenzhenica]